MDSNTDTTTTSRRPTRKCTEAANETLHAVFDPNGTRANKPRASKKPRANKPRASKKPKVVTPPVEDPIEEKMPVEESSSTETPPIEIYPERGDTGTPPLSDEEEESEVESDEEKLEEAHEEEKLEEEVDECAQTGFPKENPVANIYPVVDLIENSGHSIPSVQCLDGPVPAPKETLLIQHDEESVQCLDDDSVIVIHKCDDGSEFKLCMRDGEFPRYVRHLDDMHAEFAYSNGVVITLRSSCIPNY